MKFRVYDNVDKKYFESKVIEVFLDQKGELVFFNKEYKNFWCDKSDRYTVEFSTGLKDKNGVEIYEGDTITSTGYPWFDEGKPNYVADVEWVFAGFQYVKRCINPDKRGISNGINEPLEEGKYFEIIGNIHGGNDDK